MVSGLKWVRLGLRIGLLSLLAVTGIAAWQYSPTSSSTSSHADTLAPDRQITDSVFQTITAHISGGPVASSIMGFELLDPFLGIISVLSAPTGWATVLLTVAVPVLLTVVWGRIYCGYICPVGWLTYLLLRIRRRLERLLGRQLPSLPIPDTLGGGVVLILLGLGLAGLPSTAAFVLVHLQVQRMGAHAADLYAITMAAGVLTVFVALELLVAPGRWCAVLCPSGVVYRWLARHRLFGVVKKEGGQPCPKACTHCRDACWLGLDPKFGTPGPSCDLCLTCARSCPQARLKLGPTSQRRSRLNATLIAAVLTAFGIYTVGCATKGAASTSQLDAHPPWSVQLHHLDSETWIRVGDLRAGLAIAKVEQHDQRAMYVFSAALVDNSDEDVSANPQVRVSLASPEQTLTMDMDLPNAPRSTPRRAAYAGRAFVDPQRCHELKVDFVGSNMSVRAPIPNACDQWSGGGYLPGVFGWAALISTIMCIGVGIARLRQLRNVP